MQNRIKAYNDLTIFSGKGLNTRPHAHHALRYAFTGFLLQDLVLIPPNYYNKRAKFLAQCVDTSPHLTSPFL